MVERPNRVASSPTEPVCKGIAVDSPTTSKSRLLAPSLPVVLVGRVRVVASLMKARRQHWSALMRLPLETAKKIQDRRYPVPFSSVGDVRMETSVRIAMKPRQSTEIATRQDK